jgi:hypothetical protein
MLKDRCSTVLLCLFSASLGAAQPSAADQAAFNRSLNPTRTPNIYGLDSHLDTGGQDLDQQGNRIFTATPQASERAPVPSAAIPPPSPGLLRLRSDLHRFGDDIDSSEDSGLISKASAAKLRERLALLKVRFGQGRKAKSSTLSADDVKRMSYELARQKKDLPR